MPSAIDGLQEPNVPSLYFHDVPEDLLKPWMIALDATLIETKRMDGFAEIPTFDVLLFVGRHLGTRVDVRVYRTVK